MTYRGIVTNGVVVLEGQERLPDGTQVEILPVRPCIESLGELPAFGLWRDRTDMTEGGEASLSLRASLERRQGNG